MAASTSSCATRGRTTAKSRAMTATCARISSCTTSQGTPANAAGRSGVPTGAPIGVPASRSRSPRAPPRSNIVGVPRTPRLFRAGDTALADKPARHTRAAGYQPERPVGTNDDTPNTAASCARPGDHRRSPYLSGRMDQTGHFWRARAGHFSRAVKDRPTRSRGSPPSQSPPTALMLEHALPTEIFGGGSREGIRRARGRPVDGARSVTRARWFDWTTRSRGSPPSQAPPTALMLEHARSTCATARKRVSAISDRQSGTTYNLSVGSAHSSLRLWAAAPRSRAGSLERSIRTATDLSTGAHNHR